MLYSMFLQQFIDGWSSIPPILKIDICATAIRNQERFKGLKTVVISGERGEESKARSKYAMLEPDRSDLREGKTKRYVDRRRPIRDWKEQQVWDIIERLLVMKIGSNGIIIQI